MEKNRLSIENAKSYKTEANLVKALSDKGLDNMNCRYFVCRNLEGRYTAVFLVSEYSNVYGGYVGFAAQHGFMSV